eukprot:10619859-Prorocentrum_lima.AAC.1
MYSTCNGALSSVCEPGGTSIGAAPTLGSSAVAVLRTSCVPSLGLGLGFDSDSIPSASTPSTSS